MGTLYLFRHGQTRFNAEHLFTGWLDPELTPQGIQEAQDIAEQLKNARVTTAYCSDLRRSQQTLALVLRGRQSVRVIVDPRIRERNYGDLNGKSQVEIARQFPHEYPLWHRSYDVRPPGGESLQDVEKRVLPFIHEMLANMQVDDGVLISAHGNSLRPIRKYFEHLSNEEMCSFEHTPAKVYTYHVEVTG